MTTFEGKTAVVTGASSGIGQAIARSLAVRKVQLRLVGRKLETLERAVAESSSGVTCYPTDLSVADEVERLVAKLRRDCEHVDMLIHAAGSIALAPVADAAPRDFDVQYRVNVRAPYVLTQGLLPRLESCRGHVVFINSTAGLAAVGGAGQYSATKHALRAVADAVRAEVNPSGVRVLSVFAGRTATPMQEAVHASEKRTYQPERLLQPEDVAAVVVHAMGLPERAEVTDLRIRPSTKSY